MSFTGERPRPPQEAAESPPQDLCGHCGTPLRPDQEWCIECGAARTYIHRAPDWRIAAGLIAAVALLAAVGLGVVVVNLSASANRQTAAGTVTTTTVTSAPAPAPGRGAGSAPARAAPALASWPRGRTGWTVVLDRGSDRAGVERVARSLAGRGIAVGLLHSDDHPFLKPGYWIVFSGHYAGPAAAAAAVERLRARGVAGQAREVAPPGGR